MKKILLTLDGSPFAEAAVEPALELAQALGGELHMLSVVHPTRRDRGSVDVYAALGAIYVPCTRGEAEAPETQTQRDVNEARAYLERIAEHLPIWPVIRVVVADDAADAIVHYATVQGISYVVMATHGRSGIRRLVQGSVAEGVVRASPAPVVLVRPHLPCTVNREGAGR